MQIAMLPTAVWALYYGFRVEMFFEFNPYYWNPFVPYPPDGESLVAQVWCDGITWLPLGMLLAYAVRARDWLGSLASFLFIVFLKINTAAMAWYLILIPSFLLTLRDSRLRWTMFLLWISMDIFAIGALLSGPYYTIAPRFGTTDPFAIPSLP